MVDLGILEVGLPLSGTALAQWVVVSFPSSTESFAGLPIPIHIHEALFGAARNAVLLPPLARPVKTL